VSDQVAAYRPAPISQRDGSALANSNCRMASIATGLDYDTRGAKRSTGSKMRTYTSDQSGGTDSGDAKQAWSNGYGEGLTVRDGGSWSDALADLRAGRLVHLDVWAATVGGPCLSGSGAYGHTVAVLPDLEGSSWLVADPWCSPPKWSRVTEAKLRAGAEEWGGQVYGRAAAEPDYPTGGAGPRDPAVLAIVERVVRRMMSEAYPGHPGVLENVLEDTGGAPPILYTVTTALAPEEDTVKAPELPLPDGVPAVADVRGGTVLYKDSDLGAVYGSLGADRTLPVVGKIPGFGEGHWVVVHNNVAHYVEDAAFMGPFRPAETTGPDVLERDEEWREWLLEGSPGSSD
jgi:hypothetical protein